MVMRAPASRRNRGRPARRARRRRRGLAGGVSSRRSSRRRAPARRGEELHEEGFLVRPLDQVLRVPLDCGEERPGLAGERLHEVVGRGGERDEARREVLHRLVVPGVHEAPVRRRESGCQRKRTGRAGEDPDLVRGMGPVVPFPAREGVLDAARTLRGKVLPEGPAKRDVDDLQPAADAEDGRFEAIRPREELEIELVPPRVDVHRAVHRRLAVARRVDVGPARQEESVELLGKGVSRLDDLHLLREGPGGEEGVPVAGVRLRGVDGEDDLHASSRAVPAGFAGGRRV